MYICPERKRPLTYVTAMSPYEDYKQLVEEPKGKRGDGTRTPERENEVMSSRCIVQARDLHRVVWYMAKTGGHPQSEH